MAPSKAKPSKTPKVDDVAEHVLLNLETEPNKRPRLHKLTVKNFRCIGDTAVTIELDDIVVLVGANNVGKSSILRAYELVMEHGSERGKLKHDDAHNGEFKEGHYPEIELETVVYEAKAPGEQWVRVDPDTREMFVREKWTWSAPGAPKKVGFDVKAGDWHADSGPWGAANVAKAGRPEPHRIEAFDSPEEQSKAIIELLKAALVARVTKLRESAVSNAEGSNTSAYQQLLEHIKLIQMQIVNDAADEINRIEKKLGDIVTEVFPGYEVVFNARPEDDLEKSINLFKANPQLLMGPGNHHKSPLEKQGSGARRTLMWAALRLLAEEPKTKSVTTKERPHLLLIDEPELCLHPDAVREACRVLYDLPRSGAWQVMVTTHSPVFIDFSRKNTSIVRVERQENSTIKGTTIYRPQKSKLDDLDRKRLQMLNICDPYVAEFFFGGRTIVVEGDTEYSALKYIIANSGKAERFKNIHIIRARGKSSIVTLCKILNQFGMDYSVLHDSDRDVIYTRKTKRQICNPAWSVNEQIRKEVRNNQDDAVKQRRVRVVAVVPNLEMAFFGEEAEDEKPYEAIQKLSVDGHAFRSIEMLLEALIDHDKPLPEHAVEWDSIEGLRAHLHKLCP